MAIELGEIDSQQVAPPDQSFNRGVLCMRGTELIAWRIPRERRVEDRAVRQ